MDISRTKYGQILFEVQIPKVIKALERIADALEKQTPPEVLQQIGDWEVDQIPGFSTAHMTPEDDDVLQEMDEVHQTAVIGYEFGYIIWLGGPDDYPDNELIHDYADRLSDSILALFALVVSAGYHYIRLDNACPTYEDIPTHEW